MTKKELTTNESLIELEKLVKKIIRKSLKDNTLNYTVQVSRSNLDPNKTKYSVGIDSPRQGVQPITFSYYSYEVLKKVLEESVNTIDKKSIEIAFHEDRINSYKQRLQAHEERKLMLESGEAEIEEDDGIDMEEVK